MSTNANDKYSASRLRLAVLGSGNGSNMQAILEAISNGSLAAEITCVISDVADAGILARAKAAGIPQHYISAEPFRTKLDGEAEKQYLNVLNDYDTELIVLAGFMRIIKAGMLRAFQHRIINIHPSLLPAFPGLHAWRQALDYGTKITGCTVHFVDEGTDTGPIIIQRHVPVLDDDTIESLHARIQQQEHIAYPEALRLISENKLRVKNRRVLINNS